MTSGVVRRRVVIAGRVQGVWFRESMRGCAEAAGVSGWVRNRDDGTVEAELEGHPDAVDAVVAWARVGPSRARVDSARGEPVEPQGGAGFVVR